MSSQESTDVSPTLSGSGAIVQLTETSKLLPWLMLTSVLSGIAIAASVFTVVFVLSSNAALSDQIRIAERESRVANSRYVDIQIKLAEAGIIVEGH